MLTVTGFITNISIHALVKRATYTMKQLVSAIKISIHALVKRATLTKILQLTCQTYFNPRPREEGDGLCLWETLANVDFNPRPREEGDSVVGFL